jgi:hypothetical protein
MPPVPVEPPVPGMPLAPAAPPVPVVAGGWPPLVPASRAFEAGELHPLDKVIVQTAATRDAVVLAESTRAVEREGEWDITALCFIGTSETRIPHCGAGVEIVPQGSGGIHSRVDARR